MATARDVHDPQPGDLMDQLTGPLDLQSRILQEAKDRVELAKATVASVKSLDPSQRAAIQNARMDLRAELVERMEALRSGNVGAMVRPVEPEDAALAQRRVLQDLEAIDETQPRPTATPSFRRPKMDRH
mmetsp:Transcript_49677/g.116768  ORF Transcript_49677/g.116768 Transcript_49677/m.116768 type:complete len:129 (-) Transcript_49677:322-708(-)